jgi:hypothetical protein
MLGLNSPDGLQDCQQLLQKLIENIKNDPTNDKFHKIKLSNSAIQSRIVGRSGNNRNSLIFIHSFISNILTHSLTHSGCLEFLGAIGFKSKEIDHEKYLCVDIGAPESLQRLELGLDWLQSTVATCLSVATAGRDTCMECVIQITLVSGIRVTGDSLYLLAYYLNHLLTKSGGFMRNDTLLDVLSFVKCFYNSEKAADIVLHLPNSASEDLTCNRLTATLEELNLYPRALLISSSLDSNDRREKLHEVTFHLLFAYLLTHSLMLTRYNKK